MPSSSCSSATRLARVARHLSQPRGVALTAEAAGAAASASAALPQQRLTDHVDAPAAMTDEMRFFFDLKGWILLPAVLSADEIQRFRAAVYEQAATLAPTDGQTANGIVGNGYTVGAPCRPCRSKPGHVS